jgi:hypothetical protein
VYGLLSLGWCLYRREERHTTKTVKRHVPSIRLTITCMSSHSSYRSLPIERRAYHLSFPFGTVEKRHHQKKETPYTPQSFSFSFLFSLLGFGKLTIGCVSRSTNDSGWLWRETQVRRERETMEEKEEIKKTNKPKERRKKDEKENTLNESFSLFVPLQAIPI